ncbi:amidohydrolase family protein [Paenibacillus donghaensis]|uniref:Amidohydrolase n=1 Tax=Paenibacillus donghaensis TaxID=414771 RepID=A0A2Z2KTD2_9BACL|nr:amidohydrolase family protein [Paenibacillus donghaensis]ASA24031.1 amidohydrolase [Paenibacillus donghaensis]
MRIDSHQHYWKIERGDYGWITPKLPVLHRDFGPGQLEPHLMRHQLDGSIVVQAAPTLAETDYILSLSGQSEQILGVVGYLDPADPACREHYAAMAAHPKLVGIRVMIQEMEQAGELLQPPIMEAFHWLAHEQINVDLLVVADQLPQLLKLLEQVPHLRGVIDHIAKPDIAAGRLEPWGEQLRLLAGYPNVYCKLSGMVTEAVHQHWSTEDFRPYITQVLDCFGPRRVLFGSDWPVCLLSASYDEVVGVLEACLPEGYTEEDRERLFGRNAAEFYRLRV